MKKLYAFLFLGLLVGLNQMQNPMHGNSSGSPAGYTGSPADGQTCATAGCHSGSAVQNRDGIITTDIPAEGYAPNQAYTITLNVSESGIDEFGFSLTAEDATGAKVGTFSSGNLLIQQNGNYVTHTAGEIAASGNSKTWTVSWRSPAAGTGQVGFYGAFNFSNNNGNNSGDQIYTSSLLVDEAQSSGTSSILSQDLKLVSVQNGTAIWAEGVAKNTYLQVFTLNGQLLDTQELQIGNHLVELNGLKRGAYVARAVSPTGTKTLKFTVIQ